MNSSWRTMLRRWWHDRDELVVLDVRAERVEEPVYLRVRELEADSAQELHHVCGETMAAAIPII